MNHITNKLNLPESIVRAVANDPYDFGNANISVTGLIGPARKRQLEIRHRNEIVTDAADRLYSLYGQIVHGILERADLTTDEIITERRLFIERHGWRISGRFDRFILKQHTILQDYKFSSLWTIIDGVKPEHEQQQNIYKLMLEDHGYAVNAMQIVTILRDWSKVRATKDRSYPQKPVVVLDVAEWSRDKTETFIKQRLIAHGIAQTDLPDCTIEERWASDTVWAIKKNGSKTAVRGHAKHTSEIEADKACLDLTERTGNKHIIEHRPGESKRCALYCEASQFCDQWQAINPNKLGL